jgi:hypothetical protein
MLYRLIPKLKAEADVPLGQTASSTKKGTVDVHRGGMARPQDPHRDSLTFAR